ncbi:hypothetical protein IMSHALPRED_010677 [Imshaugia aleurites]|uniref:RING-type E3 ubiquitin transferase n=1 Tax=Imshaugia aleurites TaxID=172621 RepID=A0A8H3ESQ5_9LECA|nr:hypothetical protein IMSHALPRED_010677 [Imshaugia aleurites]
MADQGGQQRELVFCHACSNEWLRHQHGLQCPECQSDVVEIVSLPRVELVYLAVKGGHIFQYLSNPNPSYRQIDERHDPRDHHVDISDDDGDDDEQPTVPNDDSHALHQHNPWQAEAPDPDEPDIEHVEWNPAPGVHFARTSYRSSSPIGRGQVNDPFAPLFQSISTIFEGAANANVNAQGRPQARNIRATQHPPHIHRPEFASQNPFPNHQHQHIHHHSPWIPGSGPPGGRQAFTATGRIWPQNGPNVPPNDRNINNLHTVLATMLQSMQASMVDAHRDGGQHNGMPNMSTFITQMLGGVAGDAVYSEEALDRIITQMMDQNHQGSAPGPASAAAIAALPKKPADKTMMGSDGKAECSVCMEAVDIGDEVTVLPCNHWFHGDCVGAWLKEHDTCPHCRAGIMPKEGGGGTPRSPGQAPQHNQNPFPDTNLPNSGTAPGHNGINQRPPVPGAFTQPGMNQPYVIGGFQRYPEPQAFVQPRPHFPSQPSQQNQRRRSSARGNGNGGSSGNAGEGSNGSSQGSGVTGWFRDRLRGGGSGGGR